MNYDIFYEDNDLMIRSTVPHDIEFLKDHLKAADVAEIKASGDYDPESALKLAFEVSSLCLTVVYRGTPCMMFGLNPNSMLSDSSIIWLLGSDMVNVFKKKFLKLSRKFVSEFLLMYSKLYNVVSVDHKESIHWLKALGAEFGEPQPYGPHRANFMMFTIRRK